MSSIIEPGRARDILSVPLQALPDLWAQAQTGADQLASQLSRGQWARQLTGNAAGLQQQIVAAADRGLGWAPWQAGAVEAIAALPTPQLISGILFDAIFSGDLKEMTFKALRELAEIAIGEILTPFLDLLTSIPVIGWILDIIVGIVEAIVGLVKLAKASEDAQRAESTIAAAVPSIDYDQSLTQVVLEMAKTGDWTALFVPVADPVGKMIHERGFSCALIEPGGPFANWRQIVPLGDDAWGIPSGRGVGGKLPGVTSNSGLGFVPGTASIHAGIQWGGNKVVDMGDWLPVSSSAALQCWSLVWGDGPALWAVDPNVVETAWARYVSMFLEDLASGKMCPKNSPAQRQVVRAAFIRRMGLDPLLPGNKKRSDANVIETCAPVAAARALRERQAAYRARTSIAYVNQFEAPEGLRDGIIASQAALRESYGVCTIDRFSVPDGLYRSQVETAQESYGADCLAGQGMSATIAGPITWSASAPEVPDPSPAIPRARSNSTTKSGRDTPARGPARAPSMSAAAAPGDGGGSGALVVAAAAAAAAAAFVLGRKR